MNASAAGPFLASALMLVAFADAEAQHQQGASTKPVASDSAPAAAPANSFYIRGGSESPGWAFYTTTYANKLTLLAGTAQEFHSGAVYSEYIVGVGGSFFTADANFGVMPFVAFSRATDSRYVEGIVLPALNRWNLDGSAVIIGYLPLESRGVRQLWVDPATLYYRMGSRLGVGAAYTMSVIKGLGRSDAIGPSARFYLPVLPGSSVSADVLRPWTNHSADFRLSLLLLF